MCISKLNPYNMHIGDWVYVRNKCFRPIRISHMDEIYIYTDDGDYYSYADLEPVYVSDKTIVEFSLPNKNMIIKGKDGNEYLFSVIDKEGESWEFLTNSIHMLQRNYYGIREEYLKLKWKGANL